MKTILQIENLHINIDDKPVVKGVNLTIKPGEIHAIMGPNGSGKSTLANTLAGHPSYEVIEGKALLGQTDLLGLSPDERSNLGLFLAFQYPVEIPGVRVQTFLRLAHQARFEGQTNKLFSTALAFRDYVEKLTAELNVKKELLKRGLNEGFSGGEKKRLEILQMAVLEPKFAILDETDSGLDIDAIKAVAEGVRAIVKKYHTGIIVITHYQRILKHLNPDFVHVMVNGKIVESGSKELVQKLEKSGYKDWK